MNRPNENATKRWEDMARESLISAKTIWNDGDYRGSVNRSYYSVYFAAASLMVEYANGFARGRKNPSHEQLPELIRNNASLPISSRRRVAQLFRVLRDHREDADYRPFALVDRAVALECLHGATTILEIIGVNDGRNDNRNDSL